MSVEIEQIPVSDDVLAIMRSAASRTLREGESFITPRTMMIALAQHPTLAGPLRDVVDLEALEGSHKVAQSILPAVTEMPEGRMTAEEQPALLRHDTLAFKDEDGNSTVWLNVEAFAVFLEGARRSEGRYLATHLALGFVAEARRQPHILSNLKIEPGRISEAIYKLS